MSYGPYSYPYCGRCGSRLGHDSELCHPSCGGVSVFHPRAQEINGEARAQPGMPPAHGGEADAPRTLTVEEMRAELERRREGPVVA